MAPEAGEAQGGLLRLDVWPLFTRGLESDFCLPSNRTALSGYAPDCLSLGAWNPSYKEKHMQNAAVSETSFFGLIADLREEVKALFKDEVRLAKTELGEKIWKIGKN